MRAVKAGLVTGAAIVALAVLTLVGAVLWLVRVDDSVGLNGHCPAGRTAYPDQC